MFDARLRPLLAPVLDRVAAALDRPGITPDRLTLAGLATGLGSAVAAGVRLWWLALVLWLVSRALDGLDGPLARRRTTAASPGTTASGAGGFLDIACDFVVYGTTVVGVAIGSTHEPGGHARSLLPFLLVLLAYYVNGTAFLAFSSIAERTGRQLRGGQSEGRSLSFLGGLAEGAETVVVHALWLVVPAYAAPIAWVWAVVVALSAGQRVVAGYRDLA